MTKKRKNLLVSETFDRKLQIMTELSGSSTEAEAFRRAVDLYVKLMKLQLSGGQVQIVDATGATMPEAPLYDFYAAKGASKEAIEQLGLKADTIEMSRATLAVA